MTQWINTQPEQKWTDLDAVPLPMQYAIAYWRLVFQMWGVPFEQLNGTLEKKDE